MNKISCIVVNYNNEKYLNQCLNSLINQTKRIDEIIVADDCSSDGSIGIIEDYAKKHDNIVPIYNKRNLGVTRNRDNAIRQSTGRFITTLDSDDYFHPTKIDKEYKAIVNNPNAIVASNLVDVNESGVVFNIRETSLFCMLSKTRRIQHLISGAGSIVPKDMMLSKDTYLKSGGLDLNFPLNEDWEFKLRLACLCGTWVNSGSKGTYYRHTEKGLSSTNKPRALKYRFLGILKNIRCAENKSLYVFAIIRWLFIKTPIVLFGKIFKSENKYTKHIS